MISVFEETRMEGITQGRAEGITLGKTEGRAEEIIESGYEFGLSEADILARLQKKLNISEQKAQEYLTTFGKPENLPTVTGMDFNYVICNLI